MRAFVVVGLGFGDEGKGSIVDWLTRDQDASLVVRFNGGAQAAHHVVTDDNREHTFSMFGSGTLAGADTYLSEFVLVNPLRLAIEAGELMDKGITKPFRRMYINCRAPITTPFHVALNRLREMSRAPEQRHGSCGLGIGETMTDFLKGSGMVWGDLFRRRDLWRERLDRIRRNALTAARLLPRSQWSADSREEEMMTLEGHDWDELCETYELVHDSVHTVNALPERDTVVFEGAQGVLIDETYGRAPYHTWSTCTPQNALAILADEALPSIEVLGLTRAYMTRHGPGPFPTELPQQQKEIKPDRTNGFNDWQERLRYGWIDRHLLRYAADACRADGGLDGLVVTCLDQIDRPLVVYGTPMDHPDPLWNEGRFYSATPKEILPELLAATAGVPLYATSWGDTASAKRRLGVLEIA